MTIKDLKGDDPTLVAIALQALHRERAAAYHAACTACDLAGKWPDQISGCGDCVQHDRECAAWQGGA